MSTEQANYVHPLVRPSLVPVDLWEHLSPLEQGMLDPADCGHLAIILSGPCKCHYFTGWNRDGKAIFTYHKTKIGWVKDRPKTK